MLSLRLLLTVMATFVLTACSSLPWGQKAQYEEIHLMTFNVENLFDTQHDSGKDDHTYLPLSAKKTAAHKKICAPIRNERWKKECLEKDWSEEVLTEKMKRLASVVLQANSGEGPDVLFLQEVENLRVLEQWNRDHLNSRYPHVILIEGPDERGIDVALMSKLPLRKEAILHKIPLKLEGAKPPRDTRGILEAHFELPGGETLVAFAVHFPSPGNPQPLRAQALEFLNEIAAPYHQTHFVVAAGDFNIPKAENDEHKSAESQESRWLVSHLVGCKSCPGTYYFKPKDEWSFLDWMMFSKKMDAASTSWKLDQDSIRLVTSESRQKDREGRPVGFDDPKSELGVSDHFPLTATIKRRKL